MLYYDFPIIHTLDLFGTAVFAITGAMVAIRKNMDLFGVIVLAIVTAIGGGTFRDLVLNTHTIYWVQQPIYLAIASAAAILTIFGRNIIGKISQPILVFDALGLAAFAVIGTAKGLSMHVAPSIAVVMGMLTGIGGGMIRDILAAEIPMVLRKEIYAFPALCGATIYLLLFHLHHPTIATFASLGTTVSLRLAGIYWHWNLPFRRGNN